MTAKHKGVVARPNKAPLPTGESKTLNRELLFSFKYYDETNSQQFCLSKFSSDQVRIAMERLREVSAKTLNDVRQQRQFFHFHEVDWAQTTIKDGFGNRELQQLQSFQFSLANVNEQKTRVYGAMSETTFYVVWFDLNHQIWPSFKKHT